MGDYGEQTSKQREKNQESKKRGKSMHKPEMNQPPDGERRGG